MLRLMFKCIFIQVGKLQEIQSIGLPVDSLRHLGILLDAEADAEVDSPEEDSTSRYSPTRNRNKMIQYDT